MNELIQRENNDVIACLRQIVFDADNDRIRIVHCGETFLLGEKDAPTSKVLAYVRAQLKKATT